MWDATNPPSVEAEPRVVTDRFGIGDISPASHRITLLTAERGGEFGKDEQLGKKLWITGMITGKLVVKSWCVLQDAEETFQFSNVAAEVGHAAANNI